MENYLKPPFPSNESERLQTLSSYDILDTLPESVFDDLTTLIATICQTPIALVSLIDEKRQWFKSHFGLEVAETRRDIAFCAHAILEPEQTFVVSNTLEDSRFAENPLVTQSPDIRFYAGAPLISPEGHAMGTLCVIDRVPRQLSLEQIAALQILSREVTTQLILRKSLIQAKEINRAQQRSAEESQRAQEALRQSEEKYRTIIETIEEGYFETDLTGNLTFFNDSLRNTLGYCKNDLTGMDYRQYVKDENAVKLSTAFRKVFVAGQPVKELDWEITRQDGTRRFVESSISLLRDGMGQPFGFRGLVRDITDRKNTETELQRLALVARKTQNAVVITDAAGRVEWVNEGFSRITGYTLAEVKGKKPGSILQGVKTDQQTVQKLSEAMRAINNFDGEIFNYGKNGNGYWLSLSITPIFDENGVHQGFIAIEMDITERKRAEEALFQKEQQLLQSHKMEAVGQLAAGIAHEINTPTQYVGDNIGFLGESFEILTDLLDQHARLLPACQANAVTAEQIAEINAAAIKADIEFLSEEIPRAIRQSQDGIGHIAKIVGSMKEFAHPGSAEKKDADIHRAIETTVTVASNEWKYVANIEYDFDPNLHSAPVILREFNQVILNMIVNAAHAISDVVKANEQERECKGTIKISTRKDAEWAEIRIADTGGGIPVEARARIFDPFFTTKEVGRGTGQGLAISHSVIVDKHRGTIHFETAEGRGTTFIIRLPFN